MIVVDQSYVVTALITAYNNLGNNQETLGIYSVGYLKQSKKIYNSYHIIKTQKNVIPPKTKIFSMSPTYANTQLAS